ncbi:MAG: VCBS repeat-containing protein, partial [Cytophagaceae bacterium]
MAKYLKADWSGNIIKKYVADFAKDTADLLGTAHAVISSYQTRYGDFNGDGKRDILLSYYAENYSDEPAADRAQGQLVLLLGAGKKGFVDGTHLLPNDGRIMNGFSMNSAVADFNGDGADDIVLTNTNEDGRDNPWDFANPQSALFSVNGRFELVDLNFSGWGRQSVSGDFNNDGRVDFATYNWPPDDVYETTVFYFMNADGTFTQKAVGGVGGNLFVSGDFDGDGEIELGEFSPRFWAEPYGGMMTLTELNDDGSIGERIETLDPVVRLEEGISWTGEPGAIFAISEDQNGNEYLDNGLHFGATGDVNGDGADDVIAIHHAHDIVRVNGVITEQAPIRNFLEIFSAVGGNGFQKLDLEIRGWKVMDRGLFNDVKLVDWNGDGHLDIFAPWVEADKEGYTDILRVYLNDGVGNFDRLAQKFLPKDTTSGFSEVAEYTDANGDGIMDVLVRPKEFYSQYSEWGKVSETLYLGTSRIYGPNSTHNPALDGAAGFNEAYYKSQVSDAGLTIKKSMTALEHYLKVGEDKGIQMFAPGTHVFGSDKRDVIVLREGDEQAYGLGGNDKISGGDGDDRLDGGTGNDI